MTTIYLSMIKVKAEKLLYPLELDKRVYIVEHHPTINDTKISGAQKN